jgi:F0F1-type ATP synthase assembly protein I
MVAAMACAAIWGLPAGIWALVGGFICVGPSALLAARLAKVLANPKVNFGVAFLAGEIIKIALVAALFALAYSRGGGLHALALLLGFIAAVQGYFLALLLPDR